MRNIVVVDTENFKLKYDTVCRISKCTELLLFITPNSKDISLRSLKELYTKNINLEFEDIVRTHKGKNTLDFCIIAYLAMQKPDDNVRYYIY